MLKAKILMLGPCQSGKTVLANFLSDSTDTAGGEYQPTQGIRILEFEVSASEVKARSGVEVELWDVSGDKKFEGCWPAIARDTSGVIFVYNPGQPNHDKELENWMNYFTSSGVKQDQCICFSHAKPSVSERVKSRPRELKDSQCYMFAHQKPKSNGTSETELSASLNKIRTVQTNLEEDADNVRQSFNQFLATLVTALSEKREEEELSIINQR